MADILMYRFLEALADCFSSIDADESYLRAHQRRADVYLALGDFSSAAQDLISLLNRGDRDRPEVVGALADIKRRERLGGSVCIDPYRYESCYRLQLAGFSTLRYFYSSLIERLLQG